MTDVVQVSTVAPTQESARHLLQSAVKAKLAAGGRILGLCENAYWHEGTFGTGQEWVVLLITTAQRFQELENHLIVEHEWDKPELVATAVEAGLPAYLEWVRSVAAVGTPDN